MEPTIQTAPHTSIATHFSSLKDPRVVGRSAHELLDILTITILAVICGNFSLTRGGTGDGAMAVGKVAAVCGAV